MLGSSIVTKWNDLRPQDDVVGISRHDVDLRDPAATKAVLDDVRPDAVIHCAAQVGGIAANIADPTGFLMNNLTLDQSVINGARETGVEQFIYIGSSCMYPRNYRQPLLEGDVLAAPLEPTNEAYALAKISGSKFCEYVSTQYGVSYKTIIPSNLYGPNDDYTSGRSHLVAAAISKLNSAHEAGESDVEIWGDGTARREFTYVDDLGDWLVRFFDDQPEWPSLLNVGCGYDHSVLEYYQFAKEVVGFEGGFTFDVSKPAGMHQKLMDSSLARQFGWNPSTGILAGMTTAYERFLATTR